MRNAEKMKAKLAEMLGRLKAVIDARRELAEMSRTGGASGDVGTMKAVTDA
ncbi:hypothetical protein [Paenibacillus sp. P36]|uniref:hypothetical protein n=1 Tax=Paenibacillus sp. P36 TaxID=3342538 RepID=UPI0038B292A9